MIVATALGWVLTAAAQALIAALRVETPALGQIVAQVVPIVVRGSTSAPDAVIVRRAAVIAPVAVAIAQVDWTAAQAVTAVVENKVHNP